MPSIPAYCANCGYIWDGAGGIHIEGCWDVTLVDNKITCPRCGFPASMVDGTFNAVGDTLELISGPPLTLEILDKLRDISERVRSRQVAPEDAIQEAKAIHPEIGSLFERFIALGLPALAVLISLIGIYLQYVSVEMQREGLEIQKQDSKVSADFYRDALLALKDQTRLLEQSARPTQDQQRVNSKRGRPAKVKPTKKPISLKGKSKRRSDVNKARRKALKERKASFSRNSR